MSADNIDIYQERNGVWYVDLRSVKGGRKSLGTTDKKAAKLALEQIREYYYKRKIEGKFSVRMPQDPVTLQEAIDTFFDSRSTHLKPRTLEKYRDSSKAILEFFKGSTNIVTIRPLDIERYKSHRLESTKAKKPATVNRDLQFLRNLFNRLIEWEMTEENPMLKIELLREDNIIDRVLGAEDLVKFLAKARRLPYVHLAVNIAMKTGMRRNEVLNLRIPPKGDMDEFRLLAQQEPKINYVDIERALIVLNETKNKKPRQVPMIQEIKNEIIEYIRTAQREPGDYLLEHHRDMRMAFEALQQEAGITQKISWQTFRQSFMTEASRLKHSREMIQEFTGQVSPSVFARYFHPTDDAKRSLAEDVGGKLAEVIFTDDE